MIRISLETDENCKASCEVEHTLKGFDDLLDFLVISMQMFGFHSIPIINVIREFVEEHLKGEEEK